GVGPSSQGKSPLLAPALRAMGDPACSRTGGSPPPHFLGPTADRIPPSRGSTTPAVATPTATGGCLVHWLVVATRRLTSAPTATIMASRPSPAGLTACSRATISPAGSIRAAASFEPPISRPITGPFLGRADAGQRRRGSRNDRRGRATSRAQLAGRPCRC